MFPFDESIKLFFLVSQYTHYFQILFPILMAIAWVVAFFFMSKEKPDSEKPKSKEPEQPSLVDQLGLGGIKKDDIFTEDKKVPPPNVQTNSNDAKK